MLDIIVTKNKAQILFKILFRFFSYERSCSGMDVSERHTSGDGSESICKFADVELHLQNSKGRA